VLTVFNTKEHASLDYFSGIELNFQIAFRRLEIFVQTSEAQLIQFIDAVHIFFSDFRRGRMPTTGRLASNIDFLCRRMIDLYSYLYVDFLQIGCYFICHLFCNLNINKYNQLCYLVNASVLYHFISRLPYISRQFVCSYLLHSIY
jgi:hypothetical protein